MDWEEYFRKYGRNEIMYHNYPECGPGSLELEELYQAFKERLLAECL